MVNGGERESAGEALGGIRWALFLWMKGRLEEKERAPGHPEVIIVCLRFVFRVLWIDS